MSSPILEKNPTFWFYGSASIAYGIKNNAFSYLLLIYANQVLGLPGYLASLALALAMIWDAVSDLLLGHWSDKTSSRLGRRHPFMYAAFFVLPITFYALFNPVIELNDDNTFYYVLALALLIRTGTTLFEVPSTALLPDLETDYDRRNKWLALRHFFGWTGGNGIHMINFMFWVGAYGVASQTGYGIYGIAGAVVIAAAILVSSLGTQKVAAALPKPSEPFRFLAIKREIKQIFESVKNKNFAALFFYGLTVGIAGGLGHGALSLQYHLLFWVFRNTNQRHRDWRFDLARDCLLGCALLGSNVRQKACRRSTPFWSTLRSIRFPMSCCSRASGQISAVGHRCTFTAVLLSWK